MLQQLRHVPLQEQPVNMHRVSSELRCLKLSVLLNKVQNLLLCLLQTDGTVPDPLHQATLVVMLLAPVIHVTQHLLRMVNGYAGPLQMRQRHNQHCL